LKEAADGGFFLEELKKGKRSSNNSGAVQERLRPLDSPEILVTFGNRVFQVKHRSFWEGSEDISKREKLRGAHRNTPPNGVGFSSINNTEHRKRHKKIAIRKVLRKNCARMGFAKRG